MLFNRDRQEESLREQIKEGIARTIPEVTAKLRSEVNESLKERVEADRAFIKDTIGVSFKIAGAAVALVVVILGFSSWKTFGDVKTAIIDTAKITTRNELETPETKRSVEAILDRAVLDSYLVRLALRRTQKADDKPIRIADFDANRLIRMVKRAGTDSDTFKSAIEVLSSLISEDAHDGRQKELAADIGAAFAELVAAKDPLLIWISKDSEKRKLIIGKAREREFADENIQSACRGLLNSDSKLELQESAIAYLSAVRDPQAVKLLSDLVASSDLSFPAVLGLARIKPDHDAIGKWTANLKTMQKPPLQVVGTALDLSRVLAESKNQQALTLLDFAWRGSRLSTVLNPPSFIVSQEGDQRLLRLDRETLFDDTDDGSWPVIELLQRYAVNSPSMDFHRFVAWLTSDAMQTARRISPLSFARSARSPIAVAVDLSGGGLLKLPGGRNLTETSVSGTVLLRVSAAAPNAQNPNPVEVFWTDAEGRQPRKERVVAFGNSEKLSFNLVDSRRQDELD